MSICCNYLLALSYGIYSCNNICERASARALCALCNYIILAIRFGCGIGLRKKWQPVTSYYWTDIGHKKQFSGMLCLCSIVQLCAADAASSLFIWGGSLASANCAQYFSTINLSQDCGQQQTKNLKMIVIIFVSYEKSKLIAVFGLANRWNAWNLIRNRVREVVFTVYWIFINCVQ